MKKFIATLALGLSLVFANGVSLAEDAPAKPAAEAAAPAAPAAEKTDAAAPAPAAAAPAETPAAVPALVPNKGDTAWMTIATVLVILMTIPGLALFYGGLVRSKNMLSVLMQVFAVSSLIYVLWVLYGYTVAFTAGNPFFGSFDKLFFKGITVDSVAKRVTPSSTAALNMWWTFYPRSRLKPLWALIWLTALLKPSKPLPAPARSATARFS